MLRCDAEKLDLSRGCNWLARDHSRNVTSQSGEDGILEEIFRRIQPTANDTAKQRWCVEFGAWDGVHLSNTRQLLKTEGWGGVRRVLTHPAHTWHTRIQIWNPFQTQRPF